MIFPSLHNPNAVLAFSHCSDEQAETGISEIKKADTAYTRRIFYVRLAMPPRTELRGFAYRKPYGLPFSFLSGYSRPASDPHPLTGIKDGIRFYQKGGNMPKFNHASKASSIQRITLLTAVTGLYVPLIYTITIDTARAETTTAENHHGSGCVFSDSFPINKDIPAVRVCDSHPQAEEVFNVQ